MGKIRLQYSLKLAKDLPSPLPSLFSGYGSTVPSFSFSVGTEAVGFLITILVIIPKALIISALWTEGRESMTTYIVHARCFLLYPD